MIDESKTIQDENKGTTAGTDDEQGQAQNLADVYKKKLENSVSKAEYDKLLKQNSELADAVLNGGTTNLNNGPDEKEPTIDELRQAIFGGKQITNLEYIQNCLLLREKVMKETGNDIFLPSGHKVQIEQSDIDTANRVAQIYQECIDIAQGDPNVFTMELNRRTIDVGIPNRRGR